MEQITDKIERYRISAKLSKTQLCSKAGIPVRTYYTYLKAKDLPYSVAYSMLNAMGYRLVTLDVFDLM